MTLCASSALLHSLLLLHQLRQFPAFKFPVLQLRLRMRTYLTNALKGKNDPKLWTTKDFLVRKSISNSQRSRRMVKTIIFALNSLHCKDLFKICDIVIGIIIL